MVWYLHEKELGLNNKEQDIFMDKKIKALLKFEFFRDCDVLIKWREYYESKETFLDIQAVYADS